MSDNITNDIVLSSRIRLARNIPNYEFSTLLTNERSQELVNFLKDKILEAEDGLRFIDMTKLKPYEKQYLVENHVISPQFANSKEVTGLLMSNDEKTSIMLNEEDHLRIQVINDGLSLKQAWEKINKLDDRISEKVAYAFDTKIGYLTCCPTNVGTGMRASAMIHLPALNMIGATNNILNTVNKLRINVRGMYGEGSETIGNMYQISNQVSLGVSEQEIISNIEAIVNKIIEQEKIAREKLLRDKNKLEDRLYRSYGIFSNARIMSSKECIKILSDIRLGINMGIIKEVSIDKLNEIATKTQPGSLQMSLNTELNESERDEKRAEIIKEVLKRGE